MPLPGRGSTPYSRRFGAIASPAVGDTFEKIGVGIAAFSGTGDGRFTLTRTGRGSIGLIPFPQYATSVTDTFNRANEDPDSHGNVLGRKRSSILSRVAKDRQQSVRCRRRWGTSTGIPRRRPVSGPGQSSNYYGLRYGTTRPIPSGCRSGDPFTRGAGFSR